MGIQEFLTPNDTRARWSLQVLLNLNLELTHFSENEKQKSFNVFHEARITLIPKPDKDNARKENARGILSNVETQILNTY